MTKDCKEHARALVECMQQTECVEKGGSITECIKVQKAVAQCDMERRLYFECRRGQLDMRTRIRGSRSF
ncbi:unnamed protein product [Phaeothamnion confervicola]